MLQKSSYAKYGLLTFCLLASVLFILKNYLPENSAESTRKRSAEKDIGIHQYSFETSITNASPTRCQVLYHVSVPNSADIQAFEFVTTDVVERHERSIAEQQTVGGIINIHRHDTISPVLDYYMHPLLATQGEKTFHSVSAEIQLISGLQIDGQIMSPGYPDHYPNGADITWLFSSGADFRISFEVTYYSTEECCDRLTVYDGESTQSTVLGIFAGTSTSVTPSPIILESSGPSLFARFTSDCAETGQGFRAFYSIHEAPGTTTPMTTTEAQTPVTLLQDQTGYIQSPNYPQTYPVDSQYYWLISRNMSVTYISIMVEDFNTKQDVDSLYIYDGDSTSSRLLAAISGNEYSGFQVTGTETSMFLRFVTGRNFQSDPYRGFSLRYFVSGPACESGLFLSDFSGTLTTPNYPNNYPEKSHCIWSVQTETGTSVVFGVISFQTENTHDGVYVYDGLYDPLNPPDDYLYFLSGTVARGFKAVASGNRAHLEFISDYSVEYSGFEIHYEGVILEDNQCEADTIIEEDSGYITSPFYPFTYENDLDCFWAVAVSTGSYIEFELQDFQSEFGRDVLFVFDSSVTDFDYLLADFTGSVPSGFSVHSSTNVARLEFRTDVDQGYRGFNISYIALSGNPTVPTPPPDSTIGEPCDGGQYVTGSNGQINSPQYPNGYYDDLDCFWWVRGPVSLVLVFYVDEFHTEKYYDYLDIIDGNGTDLAHWTGLVARGTTITTKTNLALLWFYTDSSISEQGFNLNFYAESPGSGSGSGDGRGTGNGKNAHEDEAKQLKTRQQRIREKWGPQLKPKPKITAAEDAD